MSSPKFRFPFPKPMQTLAWLACLPLFALIPPLAAEGTQSAHPTESFEPIKASIEAEIAAGRLTGVAVALVHHGKIVWEEGFGWADRETGRKVTSRSSFSIASLSKSFTTTAAMTLADAGKLDWSRPANDYLGRHKIVDEHGPAQAVSVRRLATHSSGLPPLFAMYPQGGKLKQPSINTLIGDYGHLVAPVGERYEYSNLGFGILADIVARQAREPFGDYLQTAVFTPLGMKDSFFDTDASRRDDMVVRYDDNGKRLPFYLTATPGSGEVYASAHDMARYAMFHLKDHRTDPSHILSDAQLDELHQPRVPIEPHMSYAMGWQILRRPGEPEVVYHDGGQPGVASNLVLVPSEDAGCVVLSNRQGARTFTNKLCDRMLKTILPQWHDLPAASTPSLKPLQPLDAYVGQWRGTLISQGRHVPVELTITGAAHGTLSVNGAPAQPITDLGLAQGLLSGDVEGDIGSTDVRRAGIRKLSLGLKLRDGRIDGEIVAWRLTPDNITIYPSWAKLIRHHGNQPVDP